MRAQVGLLLSAKGLNWVGNGDYQEIGRHRKTLPKFWHRDITAKLRLVLDANAPTDWGITNKAVLAIFRKWADRARTEEPVRYATALKVN